MLCIVLTGCDFSCSVGGAKKNKKVKVANNNPALKGAIIKNGIELEVTGVKIKSAYLVDKNEKPLTENMVKTGEYIYLILEIDSGWVQENDKTFLGASEKITTAKGNVIVEANDIFKDYDKKGISPVDSKYISLSAVITRTNKAIDDFIVYFRVWDKRGSGEIKGQYEFNIIK